MTPARIPASGPPADSPDRPPPLLAVFDASCSLCRRCASFARGRAQPDSLRFVPFESAEGERALASIGFEPGWRESLVLVGGDRYWTRSDAVLELARHLSGTRMASRLLALVPRRLRDAGYDWLARNRHRICRASRCTVVGEAPRELGDG